MLSAKLPSLMQHEMLANVAVGSMPLIKSAIGGLRPSFRDFGRVACRLLIAPGRRGDADATEAHLKQLTFTPRKSVIALGGGGQTWFASVLRFCTMAARWNSSRAPDRPRSRIRSKR